MRALVSASYGDGEEIEAIAQRELIWTQSRNSEKRKKTTYAKVRHKSSNRNAK